MWQSPECVKPKMCRAPNRSSLQCGKAQNVSSPECVKPPIDQKPAMWQSPKCVKP
ncbi:hypothetical protein DPMN_122378 [Dreissena polymorpha]|uniref:Uncharacterized protein n=1 Tax=Dreissena polymorpha TaxID=45954 RepID=A0A9D4GPK1_DREPO|nr:hypothetical protein DPMN_122378 [Dreissena polymorpha]